MTRTKICIFFVEIQRSWNQPKGLLVGLSLPDNEEVVHLQPFWLMVFNDEQGTRRFFRMKDHGKKVDIDTLKHMQTLLNQKAVEEDAFIRGL